MTAIISLLVIVMLAVLITRIASVALALTGVSQELARFQARSALTGVGFTTTEAESVVNHPVRRKIIGTLMLIGSAGVVSAVSSMVISFLGIGRQEAWIRLAILFGGLFVLWRLASSPLFERILNRLIERALDYWTDLRVRDYANILHLSEDYRVSELEPEEGDWLADRTLKELNIGSEGVNILGISRCDGSYIGAPDGDTQIHPGDRVVLYGRSEVIDELDTRKSDPGGEEEHRSSVSREEERRREEAENHE